MNNLIKYDERILSEQDRIEFNEYKRLGLEYIDKKYQFILNSDENYWYYLEQLAIKIFGGLDERDMFYEWAIKNRLVRNAHQPIEELSGDGKELLKKLNNKKNNITLNNQLIEIKITDYNYVKYIENSND